MPRTMTPARTLATLHNSAAWAHDLANAWLRHGQDPARATRQVELAARADRRVAKAIRDLDLTPTFETILATETGLDHNEYARRHRVARDTYADGFELARAPR